MRRGPTRPLSKLINPPSSAGGGAGAAGGSPWSHRDLLDSDLYLTLAALASARDHRGRKGVLAEGPPAGPDLVPSGRPNVEVARQLGVSGHRSRRGTTNDEIDSWTGQLTHRLHPQATVSKSSWPLILRRTSSTKGASRSSGKQLSEHPIAGEPSGEQRRHARRRRPPRHWRRPVDLAARHRRILLPAAPGTRRFGTQARGVSIAITAGRKGVTPATSGLRRRPPQRATEPMRLAPAFFSTTKCSTSSLFRRSADGQHHRRGFSRPKGGSPWPLSSRQASRHPLTHNKELKR